MGKYITQMKVIYISWDKLHGRKLQNLLKVPKYLQFRPECRDRWPVAHYSHRVYEQLKLVSYPLSRFPLDSLDFYGIHWNETSVMLVSDINRNMRAHQSLKPPPLWGGRHSTSAAVHWHPMCELFLPGTCETHLLLLRHHVGWDLAQEIPLACRCVATLVSEAGLLDEEKLWPDIGHGNGKSNRCGEGQKVWAIV